MNRLDWSILIMIIYSSSYLIYSLNNDNNLVGGFTHFLFSIIYGIILPIDQYLYIFFRGVETTKQSSFEVDSSWTELREKLRAYEADETFFHPRPLDPSGLSWLGEGTRNLAGSSHLPSYKWMNPTYPPYNQGDIYIYVYVS